jgi:hypothetical protein
VDVMKEREEWLAAWKLRHTAAILAQMELGSRCQNARKAERDLDDLKRDNPALLDHVTAVRWTDEPTKGGRAE